MNDYKVPTEKINATVLSDDDSIAAGAFFVGINRFPGQKGHAKVSTFLEGGPTVFPFKLNGSGKIEFINKNNMKYLIWTPDKDAEKFGAESGIFIHTENVRIVFYDGSTKDGIMLAEEGPNEKSRLSDFLNHAQKFLVVKEKTSGEHYFINKSKIFKVITTDEAS